MKKHSIRVEGHPTSISLEEPFWDALKEIAGSRRQSLAALVGEIEKSPHKGNLSSAIRVFVLRHYQARLRSQAS